MAGVTRKLLISRAGPTGRCSTSLVDCSDHTFEKRLTSWAALN